MPPKIPFKINRRVPVVPVSDATLELLGRGEFRGVGEAAEDLPRSLRARLGVPEDVFSEPAQPNLPLEWDALGYAPGTGRTKKFGVDPLSDMDRLLASPLGDDPIATVAADPNVRRTRRLAAAEAGLPITGPAEPPDLMLPESGLSLLGRFGEDPGRDEAEDILLSLKKVLEPEQLEDAIAGAGERAGPTESLMHLREARGAAPGGPGRLEIDDSSGRQFVEGQLKARGVLDEEDAWGVLEERMRDAGVARPDPFDTTSLEAVGIHGIGRDKAFRPPSVKLSTKDFPQSEFEAITKGRATAKVVPGGVPVEPGQLLRVADEEDFSSTLARAVDVQEFDRQGASPAFLARIAKKLGIPAETVWGGTPSKPVKEGVRSPVMEAMTRIGRGTQKAVALAPPESGKVRGKMVPGAVSEKQPRLTEADLAPGGEGLPPTPLARPSVDTVYPPKDVKASMPGAISPMTGIGETVVQGKQRWKVLAATEGAKRGKGPVVQSVRLQSESDPNLVVRGTFQNGKLVGRLRKDSIRPENLGVTDVRTSRRMMPLALAGAAAAGASLLPGEEGEAEAGPLSALTRGAVQVADPLFQQLKTIRAAPVKQVETIGRGGKLIEQGLDRLYRVKKFLGGAEDPAAGEAVGKQVHSIAGGGMGEAEVIMDDIRQSLRAARSDGLEDALDAYLSYQSFDSAWATLADKIAAFESNARAAKAKGLSREAADWQRQAEALKKNVSAGDVAPLGITPPEIGQKLGALEQQLGPEAAQKVKGLAEGVYGATRKALELLHQNGIVGDQAYQEYIRRGGYIPLSRVMQDFDPAEGELKQLVGVINKNISGRESDALSLRQSKAIRSLEGSRRATLNPFEAAGLFIERSVREVKRNQAAKTFLEFSSADPTLAGAVKDLGTQLPSGKLPKDTGVLAFHEGGATRYFAVPREIADVMNLVHVEDLALGLKTLQRMRGTFQKLAASGNIAFAIAQTPRDIADALMLPNYRSMNPKTAMEFAGLWVKNFAQNVMEAAGAPLRPEKQEFLRANAAFAGLAKRGDFVNHALGRPQGPLSFVASKVLNPIEEATKMSTFQTLRKQGAGEAEAAFETRVFGGSPDFWQAGSRMATANEFFVFLNPQIQGINRTVAAYSRDPQKLGRHLAGLTAGLSALWAYNAQFVNPETGQREIDLVPEDERRTNVIIMLPGEQLEQLSSGAQRRRYVKIPLGHAAQTIVTPMQEILRLASGDPSASGTGVLEETLNNFLPGSGGVDLGSVSGFAGSLTRKIGGSLNPLLKAPLEQLLNERFFNEAPIVGRRVEGREPTEQYTERTSPTMKAAGQALGVVPGLGDTYAASPDRLEHLYRAFLPGLGEAGLNVSDALLGGPADTPARGELEGLSRAPVAGMLLRRFLPSSHSQFSMTARDELYALADETARATATINDLAKRDPARLEQLLAERPELAESSSMNATLSALKEQMAELGLAREQLMNDREADAGEKTRLLRELHLAELALLKEAQSLKQGRQQLPAVQ